MAQHIQHRRGTSTRWYDINPILMVGEFGYETNTFKYKVGDGTTVWRDLPYSSGLQGIQGIQGETGADSVVPGPQGIQGETGADSVVPGPTGPASAWGTIPGTLADQADLNSALSGKATAAQGALADNAVPKSAYTAANDILVGTGASAVLKKTPTEIRAILNVADGANVAAAANITDHSIVRGNGGVKGVQGSGVYIDDAGNVGIGTSGPLNILDVKVGTDQHVGFRSESGMPSIGTFNDAGTAYTPLEIGASVVVLPFGQIKFPAVQNPSSDANTLDDYEEGVFTPVVSFDGAGVTVTYTTQTGVYLKVGKRVFFTIYVATATFTHSAIVQSVLITLPFAPQTSPTQRVALSGYLAPYTKANYTQVAPMLDTTAYVDRVWFRLMGSGQAFAFLTASDLPSNTNINVAVSGSYLTA